MEKEEKLRAVRKGLGQREKIVKSSEVVFICPRPKCNFPEPKLSVNLDTDRFHCWVCDWGGKNLAPLMAFRGETKESREYRAAITKAGPLELKPRRYDTPTIPREFLSLSKKKNSPVYVGAISYLKNRGLSDWDVTRWKLGYCEEGEYKNHIVIPSFDDQGEVNFVVGRKIYSEEEPRYKHGNFSKDIIFNDVCIDWNYPVCIVEGFFDAIKAGENSIPLQGSSIREDGMLFEKIVTKNVDTYFALDPDALNKQLKIIKKFLSYGVSCLYVDLQGKKDPGINR